ncbi:MAG: 7-cyano-7-deazaguanine synthase QueC [Ammonifex sp.]|nr:MAG: 7-cyano-7-deazaguanine synthase QueC [Ammonifex sp.]
MKCVVLLSGGLDSAVSLACARRDGAVLLCLTFDYGQQAVKPEIQAAAAFCEYYKVPHRVIDLPFLREITTTALVTGEDLPEPEVAYLDEFSRALEDAARVWVPNRNGIFLNIAAAYAEHLGAPAVVAGFNREEAAAFPDNSAAFVNAATAALYFATQNHVRVISYTQNLDKTGIAALGRRLGVPLELVWSCYRGGSEPCWRCESCLRYSRALAAAKEE